MQGIVEASTEHVGELVHGDIPVAAEPPSATGSAGTA